MRAVREHSGRVLRRAALVAALVLAAIAYQAAAAQRAGSAGERALRDAEQALRDGRFDDARSQLVRAGRSFASARGRARTLSALTPHVAPIADQVAAIDTLARAGATLTAAALRIVDSARPVTRGRHAPKPDALGEARRAQYVLSDVRSVLERVRADVGDLPRRPLVGPIARTVRKVQRRLGTAQARLDETLHGLGALRTFLGARGTRRYLLLSQNPDEPRPTGGFIGSYGVLVADAGHLRLERYGSIESWYRGRHGAVVPAARTTGALAQFTPPIPQTLANANANPDWPTSARLAAHLWRRGGEAQVDGVLAFTPELVARVLRVLGPMTVPGFDRATSRNVIALLDHYTHRTRAARSPGRKRFIALLARRIMRRVAVAKASAPKLGMAFLRALTAREALVWSRDRDVRRVLAARGLDGALPRSRGDFFYDAEFAYPTKNGRELRRRFDHDVTLRADGSATVWTTITIRNRSRLGYPFQSYLALYGPAGGFQGVDSEAPSGVEPPIAGHPGVGFVRFAPAGRRVFVRITWEVPRLLQRRRDGSLVYRLLWRAIPAHRGDMLHLRVTPPAGWRWRGSPPPATSRLQRDLRGAWTLGPAGT